MKTFALVSIVSNLNNGVYSPQESHSNAQLQEEVEYLNNLLRRDAKEFLRSEFPHLTDSEIETVENFANETYPVILDKYNYIYFLEVAANFALKLKKS